MSDLANVMLERGRRARAAVQGLAMLDSATRTRGVLAMAEALREGAGAILEINRDDVNAAKARSLDPAMLDRLALDPGRMEQMADAIVAIAAIPDPVGTELARWTRPNGLDIARVRTPIGVLAVIYESRPNVTADAAALAIRSGNAVILRGGSECLATNLAIHDRLSHGLTSAGVSADAVQLIEVADRDAVGLILGGLDGAVDLIIPRGGRSLVERVKAQARAPVLGHLEGVNHVYVHADAEPAMARAVVLNAKMRRVSVCGAAETLLIDRSAPPSLLRAIAADLTAAGCELRADDEAREILPGAGPAEEADWSTEYLRPILAVRTVAGLDAALEHIRRHGTGHTEAVVASDPQVLERFLNAVDAGIVMANTSTQFADGGEFGFGGEIGISTDRLHARGPVGAEQLTTFKYLVRGTGQIRP